MAQRWRSRKIKKRQKACRDQTNTALLPVNHSSTSDRENQDVVAQPVKLLRNVSFLASIEKFSGGWRLA
jgi:hypothetical protein